MKEREFEIVLVDDFFIVLARYIRTFPSREEALRRAGALNRDLGKSAIVGWMVRQNIKWPGLYRE